MIFVRHGRRGEHSHSAVVWQVGVRGVPEPPVAHHNTHFGEELSTAFDALGSRTADARPVATRKLGASRVKAYFREQGR